MNFPELGASKDLLDNLQVNEISQILTELRVPDGLYQGVKQGTTFLSALKRWPGLNPFQFYQSLNSVRPELVKVACEIKWLCASSPDQTKYKEEVLSIETLFELMKFEISNANWELVYMAITDKPEENVNFAKTLDKLLEKGLIEKDLKTLTTTMKELRREDLVIKLQQYQNAFKGMEDGEFANKCKREVNKQSSVMKEWESSLKIFLQIQHGTVKIMLEDTNTVQLAEVYIELTVLKEKPRAINLNDETTYSEIAYLRKISNREVEITSVDFTEELIDYKSTKPEIWCLIGNPGCGKTFLAKRTALRFSSSELVGIQYSISIPCRSTDWHSMESSRYENEIEIETEYICKWLCLGLPKGPSWSKDLAKYITESDGYGLLLIIDGLDEFTRKVPFGKTFLCLLLMRQSLSKSTIILTSRPGAWTNISSVYELKIDRYYQVLGFSPANRDRYFRKQITNESKLRACWDLMKRHDEIKQLSLIPVNASLFAALLKGEDSTSISTLSKLYYELALYIIRRELSRMGLQEFSRVSLISDLHTDIQDCLKGVGLIAFLGVANRDLTSEENVPLIMRQEEYPSNCLGLAHEHYKKDDVGLIKKVWTFAHLTIQEFTAAHWLSNHTWTKQCYSIRYISHSSDNFSLFKMVVRFLCGILSDKSAAILSIMYRYLTPQPIQINNMPMTLQLRYDSSPVHDSDWKEFTTIITQMIAILFETNSKFISSWLQRFRDFLPAPIYFYFVQNITANEWICFIQSLELVAPIQLIYVDTTYINAIQLNSLMEKLQSCVVTYLIMKFYKKNSSDILAYSDLIGNTNFNFDTKISINLEGCNLTELTPSNFFTSIITNQKLYNLRLQTNNYSYQFQRIISDQLTCLDSLYLPKPFMVLGLERKKYVTSYYILSKGVCQSTQLRILHFNQFPTKFYSSLLEALPKFTMLQELGLDNYSLIPAFCQLTNLTYLHIKDLQTSNASLHIHLLELLSRNNDKLMVIKLVSLQNIGLTHWNMLFDPLRSCTNLVQLVLISISLPPLDVDQWSYTIKVLKVLVDVELRIVTLYDGGFKSLCAGLVEHPVIMKLWALNCKLTSQSCEYLRYLIPTISQLKYLHVNGLSSPENKDIKLLEKTADEYSILHKLF